MKPSRRRSAALSLAGLCLAAFLLWDWVQNRGGPITYDMFRLEEHAAYVHRFPVDDPGARHVVEARTPGGAAVLDLELRGPDGDEIHGHRDDLPRVTRRFDFTPSRQGTYELVVRDGPGDGDGDGARGPAAVSVAEGDESVLSRLTGRAAW